MVEFGLKLEDNKVEEWSDKYIDYEKLKKLIKKAKEKAENRAELERRNPPAAADIIAKYENDKFQNSTHDSNSALDKASELGSLGADGSPDEASTGEKVLLLHTEGLDDVSVSKYASNGSVSKYASNGSSHKYGSFENLPRNNSSTSLASFLKGVKKGFQFTSFETKLLDALQTETLALEQFSIAVYQEVSYRAVRRVAAIFESVTV
jgi:hypothetical protein